MTSPTAPSLSLATDKDAYDPGDPITVTATYLNDAGGAPVTLTISGTATTPGGISVTATTAVEVSTPSGPQPMDVTVTDSLGDAYTQLSNDGTGTAVFSGTVGTPPAGA